MKQPKQQHGRSPLRGLAVGIVAATGLLLLFLLYVLGRPLYWKFYAEVIHRYEPDPALALIREIEQESGAKGCQVTSDSAVLLHQHAAGAVAAARDCEHMHCDTHTHSSTQWLISC
jgi:hypothetical protein